jgi:hypothetical protein
MNTLSSFCTGIDPFAQTRAPLLFLSPFSINSAPHACRYFFPRLFQAIFARRAACLFQTSPYDRRPVLGRSPSFSRGSWHGNRGDRCRRFVAANARRRHPFIGRRRHWRRPLASTALRRKYAGAVLAILCDVFALADWSHSILYCDQFSDGGAQCRRK